MIAFQISGMIPNILEKCPLPCKHCIRRTKKTLYLTFKCNRHCPHCCIPPTLFGKDVMYLGDTLIASIADVHKYVDGLELIAVSGGEPLVDIEPVIRLAEHLRMHSPALQMCLFTNGDFLSEGIAASLVESGFDSIRISAHDLNPHPFEVAVNVFPDVYAAMLPVTVEYSNILSFVECLDNIGVSALIFDEIELTEWNSKYFESMREKNPSFLMGENFLRTLETDLEPKNLRIDIFLCPRTMIKHSYTKDGQNNPDWCTDGK